MGTIWSENFKKTIQIYFKLSPIQYPSQSLFIVCSCLIPFIQVTETVNKLRLSLKNTAARVLVIISRVPANPAAASQPPARAALACVTLRA